MMELMAAHHGLLEGVDGTIVKGAWGEEGDEGQGHGTNVLGPSCNVPL